MDTKVFTMACRITHGIGFDRNWYYGSSWLFLLRWLINWYRLRLITNVISKALLLKKDLACRTQLGIASHMLKWL